MTSAQPTDDELQEKAWKYIGYKGFSQWVASSDDFFVVRRFDTLAARVVLLLQWELVKIEKDLSDLDDALKATTTVDRHNGAFKYDYEGRQKIIHLAHEKLKNYYEFINGHAALRSKSDATADVISNVKRWLGENKNAIEADEAEFIYKDDLFPVVATSRTPLRRALEKLEAFRSRSIFQKNPNALSIAPDSNGMGTNYYYLDERMDSFVNALVCVVGFALLVVPLWILFYVSSRQHQLIVITIFIAFFLTIVQSVSVARPFESLAATAAYSAVLMVFMQIGPQNARDSV